ncbi:MAG: response regulator transcription factor, partial [Desulfosalsimonadaceae bacterium]
HLKIESEPDKGSSFHLVLPVQTAVVKTPVKTDVSNGGVLQKSIPVATRLRVLFADDHKVMRQGLSRLISAQTDIEVAGEAANGREVVELARKLRPDVIVMDISMPVMDGIEATRLIKSESPEVRIVGLSMFKDEQSVNSIMHAGADAFVPKTASTAELLEALYADR